MSFFFFLRGNLFHSHGGGLYPDDAHLSRGMRMKFFIGCANRLEIRQINVKSQLFRRHFSENIFLSYRNGNCFFGGDIQKRANRPAW